MALFLCHDRRPAGTVDGVPAVPPPLLATVIPAVPAGVGAGNSIHCQGQPYYFFADILMFDKISYKIR
jgi:hypothetical protein